MYVSQEDIAAMKRILFKRGDRDDESRPLDFAIRPISLCWRAMGRMPAYKTATSNAAYIMRDDGVTDRFGSMPQAFATRRYELRAGGLLLPNSAPKWAEEPYRIWQEADAATDATGDPTAVSAWHVMCEIPKGLSANAWERLVREFVGSEIVAKGAAAQWAIHAVEGDEGTWIVAPHAHVIVSARRWRHDARHGERHSGWAGEWAVQTRLAAAWRRHVFKHSAIRKLFSSQHENYKLKHLINSSIN